MNKLQAENAQDRQWQDLTLSQYVRFRNFAFLFTPWFFLLGGGAVLGRTLGMDMAKRPFWLRASINFIYLVTCLVLTFVVKKELLT